MNRVAIVISLVSAAVALGGLIWQIGNYRLTGARVRLDVEPALLTHRGTLITWTGRRWPKDAPASARIDDQDMWVELARLRVANLGRTIVWVADLGLDFGRSSRWPRRQRTTMTLRPIAVSGGLTDNNPIRLEPGQSASMFVPIAQSVDWAAADRGRTRLIVRATTMFGATRARRSARRRSWKVGPDSVAYPHLQVTPNVRLYRELLDAWPTSDISRLYEACIEVLVAINDPSRGSLIDVLEPFIPSLMTRVQVAARLAADRGPQLPQDRPVQHPPD